MTATFVLSPLVEALDRADLYGIKRVVSMSQAIGPRCSRP
jgi:hypothetical protein